MAKRETNAQRIAREDQRRAILEIAGEIAVAILSRKRALSLAGLERQVADCIDEAVKFGNHAAVRLDAAWIKNQSVESIAKSLRLAANILEKRPMDGRSLGAHDNKVRAAYYEACKRLRRDDQRRLKDEILRTREAQSTEELLERCKALLAGEISFRITGAPKPTFYEVLEVYRQQNPRVKVEDRTLRRSVNRLGLITRPDKRGRPKRK